MPLSPATCCRPCLPSPANASSSGPAAQQQVLAHQLGPARQHLILHMKAQGSSQQGPLPGYSTSRSSVGAVAPAASTDMRASSPTTPGPAAGASTAPRAAAGAAATIPGTITMGMNTADVLAIVSVGCHPSSGIAAGALRCESSGASFATGFADADRVGYLYQDAYYPLDQVRCL